MQTYVWEVKKNLMEDSPENSFRAQTDWPDPFDWMTGSSLLLIAAACAGVADAAALMPSAGAAFAVRSAVCASSAMRRTTGVSAMFGLGGGKSEVAAASSEPAPAPAAAAPDMVLETPKTIGDAKRNFQAAYKKPVGPIAQGFVSELLASCTVAMASPSFKYSPIFALGVEQLCVTFLEGMTTPADKAELQSAICAALGLSEATVLEDAATLRALAETCATEDALFAAPPLAEIAALPAVPPYKYSYAFGAGVIVLMPLVGVEVSTDAIGRWCGTLKISPTKLKKDWGFFEASIDRLAEAKVMVAEMKAAAKRKEASKLKELAEAAAKEAAEAETASAGAATSA